MQIYRWLGPTSCATVNNQATFCAKMFLQLTITVFFLPFLRSSAEAASCRDVSHLHGLRTCGSSQTWWGTSPCSWGHAVPKEPGTLGSQHCYGFICPVEHTGSRGAVEGPPESPTAVLALWSEAAGTGAASGKTADEPGTPVSALWPHCVHFWILGITWATPRLPS